MCVSCLAENEACQEDSDCCSGYACAGQSGYRRCVPKASQSFSGSPCADQSGCQPSPPSFKEIYCDLLNPNPAYYPGFAGVCRWCIPQAFACEPSSPLGCCSGGIYVYECRVSPAGGFEFFCLPIDGASPNNIPTNWAFVGDNVFAHGGNPRSGGSSLYLRESGGGLFSYAYNTELVLNSSSMYLIEFWTINNDGNPRYSVYDANNNAYLQQNGEWIFSPKDIDNKFEQPVLIDLGIGSSGWYSKYSRKFSTLSSNVSHVQLRLYPPKGGSEAYIDDLDLSQIYDFTIIVWFKPQGKQNDRASILWNGNPESEVGLDWYMNSDGSVYLSISGIDSDGNLQMVNSGAYVANSNWHQLALAVERIGSNGRGYYRAYLDAGLIGEGEFPVDRLNSSSQFWIGRNGAGGNAFKGRIDELRIYRRALGEYEIAQAYRRVNQQRLEAEIFSRYANLPASDLKDLGVSYNAEVRIRKSLPQMVLYYPLDQPPIAGAVPDSSPMLSHGRNIGANWSAFGKSGPSFSFGGNGEHILLGNKSLAFGISDFTVSAWIYPQSFSSGSCGPSALFTVGESEQGAGVFAKDGRLAFTLGTGEYALGSSFSSLLGKWTHVAAVRKGGNISIYENGVLAGSAKSSQLASASVYPSITKIGGALCSPNTFSGHIDEFRAFSRALSAEEIKQLHADSMLSVERRLASQWG
ncbi:MAG: LamG domain-containing protein [Candidatus Micrarchaeota archaeon]|nr:LamG domain-containing protein [Candidatus Micrarchaeota archaeon]